MNAMEKDVNPIRVKKVVGFALSLWLVLILILGAGHAFARGAGNLPFPVLAGFLAPIFVFLVAFWTVGAFRDYVLSVDLAAMAGIQAWRFGGLGFIALYAYGVLPGLFAWPAGLGDMAIGLTAPLVILALRRQPSFAAGLLFQVWNLLGILDLIVAVSLGATSAILGIGISAEVTTFPMGEMPLVLVPVFLVPLFVILHLASLLQARRMVAAGKAGCWDEPSLRCEPMEAMPRA